MSVLKKPYEISIWEDVWDSEQSRFVEKRLFIIGSDSMLGQNRALEPNLVRNVNGTKKFSFKMYKKYIDTTTGESVTNLFCDFLTNERKVKLKYGTYIENGEVKDRWYDFVIKNVTENSSTHLQTYQLEDALVQELSKNGFNKTLDAQLMNNTGSAKALAEYVLSDTDWKVNSETFVQTIEEPLVYLKTTKELPAQQLLDSGNNFLDVGLEEASSTIPSGVTILAFYSSCRNKPHRFQFIYTNEEKKINTNRVILNKDCQYYIDIDSLSYPNEDPEYGFYLPEGFALGESGDDTVISTKYRGARYGFAQKQIYSPLFERYVSEYIIDDQIYYGYVDNEYHSPVLTTNLVTNTEFKNISGWQGAKTGGDTKATIENVYGKFNGRVFKNALDDPTNLKDCESYLKITLPDNGIVFNSGIYDNRVLIGNMEPGSKWALTCEYWGETAELDSGLNFTIADYDYVSASDIYTLDSSKFNLTESPSDGNYAIYTVDKTYADKESFRKNSKIKIAITGSAGTYYIKNMQFFAAHYKGEELITPESAIETEGIITKTYYYFNKDQLDKTDVDDVTYAHTTNTLEYGTYKPVYNTNGEKIRSVTAKESNYFNILQSIAETFECWLELLVERDDNGGITEKTIKFKNYSGQNNCAAFRYGVNLKDVQRTYESKNIVTKLIVKQNSNDLALNGFCTIARAKSNPTGENYIYDFQYYQNKGLMNAEDYIDSVYKIDGNAQGKDIDLSHNDTNINGYFPRLRAINDTIISKNELLSGIAIDLLEYKAKLEVANAAYAAAISGIEEVTEDLLALTKLKDINAVFDLEDKSNEVQQYLTQYVIYKQTEVQESTNKDIYAEAVTTKEDEYNRLKNELQALYDQKDALNTKFYEIYSRFIQEGTWISEEYVDDEKYYIDAQSVMYNSCYPQVAYTINTINIAALPGYELFDFEPGEKTYVEDEAFFGRDKNGELIREEVIIAEISENLDDPSKNTNRVQNFKNQFQDLFHKITATTQSAQYNSGAYTQGAALAKAIDENRIEFLTETLDEMTVNLTDNPVIESTSVDGSSAVKIIDGKILFSTEKDGEKSWTIGMSSKGISANKITAGQIDTGIVQVMNGTDPLFRWDTCGISAYDAVWYNDEILNTISGINSKKFVRFDKNGIYGIQDSGIDGSNWCPTGYYKDNNGTKIWVSPGEEIQEKAAFYLTWDGMQVIPGNLTYTNGGRISASPNDFRLKMGRVDDYIYNYWDNDGMPQYEATKNEEFKFVKVFSVGDYTGSNGASENLVIYSDGTLVAEKIKLPGSIEWTEASSPSKNVYASSALNKPENGKKYSSFDDLGDTVWHKIWDSEKDTHYCHTDNGGATWEGPFLLTGRSIVSTTVQYAVAAVGLTNEELAGETSSVQTYNLRRDVSRAVTISWEDTIQEAGTPTAGQCLYIRIRDNYNDGESSAWRFFAGTTPTSDLTLSATSLVVQEDQNGKLTPDIITLTATAENLPESEWGWSGVTSSNNTAIFYTADMLDSKTITVTYGDYSDSVTIIKVKEGSDAVSYVLSNPTMVFNKADTDAVETCSVIVYRGATSIPYGAATEYSNGWYYTLAENDDKVIINGNGAITVTNPGTTQNIAINLTLYKGSEYANETKELNISCTVLSNLKISLTNDSGVVVTDADGNNGRYGPNTTTTAKVYEGSTDVSSGWTFSASFDEETISKGATVEQNSVNTNIFKVADLGSNDSAVLTITATKGGGTLTTDFVVSKLKQGVSGSDAISCYIDSSKGNLLLDTDSGTVILTARIFIGQQEFDKYENLQYNWYVEGESDPINENSGSGATDFNERTITLNAEYVKNKTFYFTATEKQS